MYKLVKDNKLSNGNWKRKFFYVRAPSGQGWISPGKWEITKSQLNPVSHMIVRRMTERILSFVGLSPAQYDLHPQIVGKETHVCQVYKEKGISIQEPESRPVMKVVKDTLGKGKGKAGEVIKDKKDKRKLAEEEESSVSVPSSQFEVIKSAVESWEGFLEEMREIWVDTKGSPPEEEVVGLILHPKWKVKEDSSVKNSVTRGV